MTEMLEINTGESGSLHDLQAGLHATHGDKPKNHEHWSQIDAQIAAIEDGESVDTTMDELVTQELDDRPTLTEVEWAEAVQTKVAEEVTKLREQMDNGGGYDDVEKVMRLRKDLDGLRPYLRSPALSVEGARLATELLLDINDRSTIESSVSKSAYMLALLPPTILRQLYLESRNDEDGLAARVGALRSPDLQLSIITAVYGDQKDAPGYADDLTAKKVDAYYYDGLDKRIALLPEIPRDSDMLSVAEFNTRIAAEMLAILGEIGLPQDLVINYAASAMIRLRRDYEDAWAGASGVLYSGRVKQELRSMVNLTNVFSSEQMVRLNKKLGVENIWAFQENELENMISLLDEDPSTIEHFKNGDVTVEFIDSRNDWNGALIKSNDPYIKPSGRTLRFEIHQPSDIYRRTIFLGKLGIKPSVFVYSAHGKIGLTDSGDFRFASYGTKSENAILIPGTQLGRMVRDFMQPNRGVDSEPENIGRIQFILNSCSGDVPYMYNGKQYPSTAEAVAKAIGDSGDSDANTDVYAAPGVARITEVDGRVVFNVRDDPDDEASPKRSRMHRLTPETRGGALGFPKKTYIRRVPVNNVSVGKQYA